MSNRNHLYSFKAYKVNYKEGDSSLERTRLIFPESQEDEYHTIRQGETLRSIAFDKYGDGTLWYLIADANIDTLENNFDLEVGSSLRIPSSEHLQEIT